MENKDYQKRVAAIHDLSGFGKCSLTVALPILSAAGIEACAMPTAITGSSDIRAILHNLAGTVCQLMQNSRIRTGKLRFNRIFFEHQIVAVHLYVSIRIML